MQLTDKDLIDFLTEIKDQLKQTMQSENIPEWELDRLFEKMILSQLDGSGIDEMSQEKEQVSEYYQDLITPDVEQSYDGSWHKV